MWQEQMVRTLRNIIIHPSITTLKYPRVETALQSVRTLFDLIDRKKVVKRQILSGTLIERESTRKL